MSSTAVLVGIYQPGRSLLHRLPVGAKLLGVAVLSVLIVSIRSLPSAFVFLAVGLALAAVARLRPSLLWRSTRFVLLVAAVIGAFQWWFYGRDKAIESFVDLVSLALVALALTATTPVNAMLDAIVRWIGPLRRLGVEPERVALVFSLAIAALPGTVALALETRDAARARGLGRHPRAFLTPFVIRVVGRAHETGDALQARGLAD